MAITTNKENTLAIEVANLDDQNAFNFPITSGVPGIPGTSVGQRAYDPTANIIYVWDGSIWQAFAQVPNNIPIISSATVTWKPSLGTDTDSAFAAFDDAYNALIATGATIKTLVIEDFNATVPAGTWDMSNINITGSRKNSSNFSVIFAATGEWLNPLTISNLTFSNTGATASWIRFTTDLTFFLTNSEITGRVGAASLIEIDGSCTLDLVLKDSSLLNSGGVAINYGFALFVKAFGGSSVGANAIDVESSGPVSFQAYDSAVQVSEPQLNGALSYTEKLIVHRNRFDVTGAGTSFISSLASGNIIVENTAAPLEILRFNLTEIPGTEVKVHLLASSLGNVDVQDSASSLITTLTPGDTALMVWDVSNWVLFGTI